MPENGAGMMDNAQRLFCSSIGYQAKALFSVNHLQANWIGLDRKSHCLSLSLKLNDSMRPFCQDEPGSQ